MATQTFDPLPEDAREILEKGDDVRLHALQNVAPGTFGAAVHALERRGLFVMKEHHVSDQGPAYDWWRFGLKEA